MTGGIRLGLVGCGSFAQCFVPLFKAHPHVEWVAATDLVRERRDNTARTHGLTRVFDSFEDTLKSREVNAVAIFAQRHLHGPLTIAALQAGKNVYSVVPVAFSVEEVLQIAELVKTTGLTFSMGETGYYRPCTIFCREKMRSGEMGDFVYGESQYYHDMRHLYGNCRHSGGENWKQIAGFPPSYYPTHSTSMILSSVRSRAVSVSGFGYVDHHEDAIFGVGRNLWDNPFSNMTMVMRLANGGVARVNEYHRIAWKGPTSYIGSLCGTNASYEFSMAQHHYVKMDGMEATHEDVSSLLNPSEMVARRDSPEFYNDIVNDNQWTNTPAPIQRKRKLPPEFDRISDVGHAGTHKFMVDDFCKAAYTGKLSPTNIWAAARFNLPGLVAQDSALRDGEPMAVPDCGEPPADWEILPDDE